MKKLQLEDLSKQLGYSKTLISMVLNGKGNSYGISKKTQAIVLDAIAELNYTPNKFAKSLRTGKSNFIGLIVSDISNTFYSTIAKNIESVLFANQFNLMVCSTEEDVEREKLLVEMMVSQQSVDGLIVASSQRNSTFYDQPRFSKIPTVFIDRVIPLFNANYVIIDNYGGSLEMVNFMIKEGYKHIACFAITPLHLSTIEDRLNGYYKAFSQNGLSVNSSLVKSIHFERIHEDVELGLRELFQSNPETDAIFTLNNNIAVALLSALRKKEFEKYVHIKITCFDDIELFDIIDKKVISVSQPIEEIGRSASNLVLDIISGKHSGVANFVLPTKLIVR